MNIKELKELIDLLKDTEVTELEDMLQDWPDGESRSFSWIEMTYDENGMAKVTEKSGTLTKEQASGLLEDLKKAQANHADMSEMGKFNLQKHFQDYQQAVQTLAVPQRGRSAFFDDTVVAARAQ